MRKTPTLTITFVVCLIALTALGAIIRYTDKPNSIAVGSDFFSLQRNQDYINTSVNQFSNMLYTSPFFTGNGQISGNWIVGGTLYGNGAGLSNVATAVYFLSTNGVGQNPTFYGGGTFFGAYYFDEVDAKNFYPTNVFLNITNKVLSTDANGQPLGIANAHGVLTNTASGPSSFGLLQNTELANSSITVQGSSVALGGSTLAAGSSPFFNAINFTNSGYSLPTNNVGGGAFVFGGPGTASTLYDTNITTATTLKLFDITACGATAGGIKIYVTCSGGTDRILTFPAGCSGAGLGTPPAVTITNAKAAFFDVIYKPGATAVTNVFWSPVY